MMKRMRYKNMAVDFFKIIINQIVMIFLDTTLVTYTY